MSVFPSKALATIALLVLAGNFLSDIGSIQAATINTYSPNPFTVGDNGADGNMFDIQTFSNPITITSIGINVGDSSFFNRPLQIDVYTRAGSYGGPTFNRSTGAGYDKTIANSPVGWTLVSRTSATATTSSALTAVDVNDFTLPSSSLNAIYVDLAPNNSLPKNVDSLYYRGSNGSPPTNGYNTSYANADLQLLLGIGVAGSFGCDKTGGYVSSLVDGGGNAGSAACSLNNFNVNGSRIFNGDINYIIVPFEFQPASGLLAIGGILGVSFLGKRFRLASQTQNSNIQKKDKTSMLS